MKNRIVIEVDPELKRQFKGKASLDGKSIKQKLIELINQYLKRG